MPKNLLSGVNYLKHIVITFRKLYSKVFGGSNYLMEYSRLGTLTFIKLKLIKMDEQIS